MISPSSNHNEKRSHCFCALQNKGSKVSKKILATRRSLVFAEKMKSDLGNSGEMID